MGLTTGVDAIVAGTTALAEGRWRDARAAFEARLHEPGARDAAEALRGLAAASWWLGDTDRGLRYGQRAYAAFRAADRQEDAIECAVWMAITYKANYGNAAAANGWLARAERLLAQVCSDALSGWVSVARAYRLADLEAADRLTRDALVRAETAHDVDLELVARSQLGLIEVARGRVASGFAFLDEAVAAALAGERGTLDTVVYTCCDMLTACDLAQDVERAAEWCRIAEDFVATYGCPFLYAECRILYGSVLLATGCWAEAEDALLQGVRAAADAPALKARGTLRLAVLRTGQGRLDEAEELLAAADLDPGSDDEAALAQAGLALARAEPARAVHLLAGRRTRPPHPESPGALEAAWDEAAGLVALGGNDPAAGVRRLEKAAAAWAATRHPFETARTRSALGAALGAHAQDRADAAQHLLASLATFRSLGATSEASRTAARLRRLGMPVPRGPSTRPLDDGLTDREDEVLGLLSVGLSNPEIAARLFVSRKTAAHHVSSILTKLGLRNRSEAAAYAAARGVRGVRGAGTGPG